MRPSRPEVSTAQYRKSVALFATGIVVVTAVDAEGKTHGATVNSFTSVSLDPPTVMVSLRKGKTHSLISESGWYGVSVLSQEQSAYASHFSGPRDGLVEPDFVSGDHVSTLEGSLARFECEVMREIGIHDHTLFVARVDFSSATDGIPLVFFGSRHSHVLQLG
ncbi:styrene monooxygenase NADH-dependent flavin reductase subunit StyB [Streptomyces sp. NBC_01089]|uniref:styrene monooxygenase NADH-dependent flavin reductase subunit StyB n=1 Tax=Streptomyces sp. NBC_01089 TaxID=2903747 RepID=UPI00386DCB36|nr:flavin reductase family protein [Streptomyces sp. NBC_01089]